MSDEDARAGGSSRFETPLQPLGVSGGTAAFYLVTYRDGEELSDPHPITGEPVGSRGFWIGKDFARARDELDFYESAKDLQARQRKTPCHAAPASARSRASRLVDAAAHAGRGCWRRGNPGGRC